MKCAEVKEALPAYVKGEYASLALRRHVAGCAGCGAELARYEQLVGALAGLQAAPVEPPPGLLRALSAIPSEATVAGSLRDRAEVVKGHVARNRGAYLGGAGVALAGAVGAALWRTRARRFATA
ncbi:MAG: anti-sigma factor [Actinomycetota bacterium]